MALRQRVHREGSRHRRPSTLVALVAISSGLALSVWVSPAYADTPAPTPATTRALEVSGTPQVGRIGDKTHVIGIGWPANAPIQVSTCGNNALNGSPDCNTDSTQNTVSDGNGNFQFDMQFGRPTKPCPCVLHTYSPNLNIATNFPIQLLDMPTAPPSKDSSSRILKLEVDASGAGPIWSWLGFPAQRSLDATITNTGTLPVLNPPTFVYLGKGQDPTTLLVQPSVGSINPGESVRVEIPFELPALSFGSYTVKIDIPGTDAPASATTTTATYPWLLFIVVWLLIQIPLLGLHRRRDDDPDHERFLIDLDDPFGGLAVAGTGTGAAVAALAKPGLNGSGSPIGAASLSAIPGWALGRLTGLNPTNPTPTLTPSTNGHSSAAEPSAPFGVSKIRQFVEAPPTNGHPVTSRVVIGSAAATAMTSIANPNSGGAPANPYAPPPPPPSPTLPSSLPPPPIGPPTFANPTTNGAPTVAHGFDPLDPSVPLSSLTSLRPE